MLYYYLWCAFFIFLFTSTSAIYILGNHLSFEDNILMIIGIAFISLLFPIFITFIIIKFILLVKEVFIELDLEKNNSENKL